MKKWISVEVAEGKGGRIALLQKAQFTFEWRFAVGAVRRGTS